jgi:hypothetical protein
MLDSPALISVDDHLPVITFMSVGRSHVKWRVGDPYVTRTDDGVAERYTDWWQAYRDHPRATRMILSAQDQAILDAIHLGARFYGPNPMDEGYTAHLMEHLLCCAQGGESAHSVHIKEGGHGPFWYTVWCTLRGLPIPTPPDGRGCCYPIEAFGAPHECVGCGSVVPPRAEPVYPI